MIQISDEAEGAIAREADRQRRNMVAEIELLAEQHAMRIVEKERLAAAAEVAWGGAPTAYGA